MQHGFWGDPSISNGDAVIFFASTICITLWIMALAMVNVPPALRAFGNLGSRPPAV